MPLKEGLALMVEDFAYRLGKCALLAMPNLPEALHNQLLIGAFS